MVTGGPLTRLPNAYGFSHARADAGRRGEVRKESCHERGVVDPDSVLSVSKVVL